MTKYVCYGIMVVMSVLGGFAGLFLKKGTDRIGTVLIFKIYQLYIGGLCYALAAVLNIIVLKYLDYSVVMPLMATTYIWTIVFSKVFLKEKITARKIAGLSLIIAGLTVIAVFH